MSSAAFAIAATGSSMFLSSGGKTAKARELSLTAAVARAPQAIMSRPCASMYSVTSGVSVEENGPWTKTASAAPASATAVAVALTTSAEEDSSATVMTRTPYTVPPTCSPPRSLTMSMKSATARLQIVPTPDQVLSRSMGHAPAMDMTCSGEVPVQVVHSCFSHSACAAAIKSRSPSSIREAPAELAF